jgi:hypothetical protein
MTHGTLIDGIYTKHEDEANKLRLGRGSWSINLEELPEETQLIEYVTPLTSYVISREDAEQYGFIKILGGERKLIVPLKKWQQGAVAVV